MGDLRVRRLGCVPYAEGLGLQERCVEERRAGRGSDTLFLLEHPPVVTLGRGAREENLRASPAQLAEQGVELHRVSRGGDVTYHAPGQLVGYLVVDLAARGQRDAIRFLRAIEAALCEALRALGLPARTLEGMTGVFADTPPADPPRKLASIGVGLRNWISYHGFALNVDLDLTGFERIVPCGLPQVRMSSLARELGDAAPEALAERSRDAVEAAFVRRWA